MLLVPLFDLKFLTEFAVSAVGTSNRRHQRPCALWRDAGISACVTLETEKSRSARRTSVPIWRARAAVSISLASIWICLHLDLPSVGLASPGNLNRSPNE